jgi:hypothetical protein
LCLLEVDQIGSIGRRIGVCGSGGIPLSVVVIPASKIKLFVELPIQKACHSPLSIIPSIIIPPPINMTIPVCTTVVDMSTVINVANVATIINISPPVNMSASVDVVYDGPSGPQQYVQCIPKQ